MRMPRVPRNKQALFLMLDEIIHQVVVVLCLVIHLLEQKETRSRRNNITASYTMLKKIPDQISHMKRLVELGDSDCIDNLRMSVDCFRRLCYILEHRGSLVSSRYVSVAEKVAMFSLILAHHTKNRIIRFNFMRSGQTMSKYFHDVLSSIITLHKIFLVEPSPVPEDSTNPRWRCFKGCLGALDGTYIDVTVRNSDKPRYRNRKGQVSVNVLGVCDRNQQFVYVLPGWEGSAADARVLRDALNRPYGLRVPQGSYYLCDNGYPNGLGFLAPYKGVRYHLEEWNDSSRRPRTPQEYFNMKHMRARNVIERTFGVLKKRWGILRSPSFYPIKTHNRIIMACCLLHNFIRREMVADPLDENLEDYTQEDHEMFEDAHFIDGVEGSHEWNVFRDSLAENLFNERRNKIH